MFQGRLCWKGLFLRSLGADKSAKKRRRWSGPAKIFTGVAAAFAVLVSVSMTSSAMRAFWIEKLGWVLFEKPGTMVNNDKHFDSARDYDETEALNVIKNSIGIRPIYFREKPKNMIYDQVHVDEDAQWAKMFYEYKENVVTVLMEKAVEEMSLGRIYDGQDLGGIEIEVKGQKIVVHKIQRDEINTAFSAETEYGNVFYSIIGDMEEEEFMDLMEQIAFW